MQFQMLHIHEHGLFVSSTSCGTKGSIKESTVVCVEGLFEQILHQRSQIKRNLKCHMISVWVSKKKKRKKPTYPFKAHIHYYCFIFSCRKMWFSCQHYYLQRRSVPWKSKIIKYSPLLLNEKYQCSHFYPLQLAESSSLPFVHLLD